MAFNVCSCVPHRYLITVLSFWGMLVSVGYRTCFALVLTHIATVNVSSPHSVEDGGGSSLFPNCTTSGKSDWKVDWSGTTLFLFHTAFFIGQFVTSCPGSALLSRFSQKRCFGLSILATSVLFLLLPGAAKLNKNLIFLIRALQGVVESLSVPSMNAVIAAWAPQTERARMINIAYAGVYLSPAVAMITTGATTCYVSWDSIIYIYGSLGALWSIVWLAVVYPTPTDHPNLSTKECTSFQETSTTPKSNSAPVRLGDIPWRHILTSMPVLAIFIASLCRNFIFAMLITEVQQYYKDVYQLKTAMIGVLSAVPHVLMVIFMLIGAFCFDALVKSERVSVTFVRKLAQGSGFGIQGACVLALAFLDNHIHAFILLCVGVAFSGFAISGFQTNPLDLAPKYAAVLTGIARTGMAGAIISTVLASQFPGKSHSLKDWQNMFLIAGSLHLAGVVFYLIFASGRLQPWADNSKMPPTAVVAEEATGPMYQSFSKVNPDPAVMEPVPEPAKALMDNAADCKRYGTISA